MHRLMFLPSIFERLLTTEKNAQPRQEPNQNDKSKARTEEIGTATNPRVLRQWNAGPIPG